MVTLSHPPSGARVDVPADAVIAAMGAELARLRSVDDELQTVKRVGIGDATELGRLRTRVLDIVDALERTPSPANVTSCAVALREAADAA
jgi:hypothetical protein